MLCNNFRPFQKGNLQVFESSQSLIKKKTYKIICVIPLGTGQITHGVVPYKSKYCLVIS